MTPVRWRLVAERWGPTWRGFIVELPGCQVTGGSLEELVTQAPKIIEAHRTWLHEKGLSVPRWMTDAVILVEIAEASSDGRGPLFEVDQRVITAQELDHALEVGEAIINELIVLAHQTRRWETLPAERRAAGWTPLDILRRVAELDRWYAARLAPDAGALTLPEDALSALRSGAQVFVSVVRAWWAVWGNQTVEREGERWTVGKLLRRRTAHVREQVEELRAWATANERE